MGEAGRYDLVVIGAGPGGYVAAVRAAQLGMRVACVEAAERLGGVCLRVGCIPSKALLDSSEHFAFARGRLGEHGVRVEKVELDLEAMMARKERVVRELSDAVADLLRRNGVEVVRGTARLRSASAVEVAPPEGGEGAVLETAAVLLATGSEPAGLPGLPWDGERIVTSTEALAFEQVPEHLGIVGGGYIGLELGAVWARLGARVTVIEALPRVAATLDGQIGRYLERSLKRQGIELRPRTRVLEASVSEGAVRAVLQTEGADAREVLECDRLLVAVGRRPLTRGLGLEAAGVRPDPRTGRIPVDARYRTAVPGICAVGDLVDGPMLAHKASAEGVAAVECLAGLPGEVNYDALPAVVYTAPEVASVGWTEEQVKARGVPYAVGVYPFAGVGRARCAGETEGMVKVLAHARTDRILGVHIVGPRASDLIAEAALAVELGASAEDLARTVHGHPTFAEALMEAAAAVRPKGP